jgi:outer membrane protein OmpA-like peptidoglycan-associated protein
MKKILLCVSVFLWALGAGFAQTADDFEVLQKPDNTIAITGYSGSLQSPQIPATLYGQTVNEIGSNAFSGKTTLRTLVLPDSIQTIGNAAFAGCVNLQSVAFGESVTGIGDNAFSHCAITRLSFPQSLRSIGNSAFSGNKLNAVIIPDPLERIGVDAFSNNPGLSRIVLGGGIQNVYFNAFGSGENPVTHIAVKKDGIDLGGINLDQNFINMYNNGGTGVYRKEGSAWIKDDITVDAFIASLDAAAEAEVASANVQNPAVKDKPEPVVDENPLGKTWIIYFGSNGASLPGNKTLAGSNKTVYETLAVILEKYPSYRVRITGYVNPLNPTAREERTILVPLSLKRAQAVAAMLEFYGVAPRRMLLVGGGSTNPIAGYNNRADWYRNRRAEITVIR